MKRRISRITDVESKSKPVVTSEGRSSMGVGEGEIESAGCKIGSRMYCTLWGI